MNTPITSNQEKYECLLIQNKNTRIHNDYMNLPKRHSERIQKLQLHDDYESAPKYCSHPTKEDVERHPSALTNFHLTP